MTDNELIEWLNDFQLLKENSGHEAGDFTIKFRVTFSLGLFSKQILN